MSVVEKVPAKFGDRITALQRDIICVLAGCDGASGQEVKQELEDYYGETVNRGRLYPNLDVLVEYGFVEKSPARSDGRSNTYTLAETGRRAYATHQDWQPSLAGAESDGDRNRGGESGAGAGGDPS